MDFPPLSLDFKVQVREELKQKSGCPIIHTKYLGRNFFLIEFKGLVDCDSALDFASWFYERKFLYTFHGSPTLMLQLETITYSLFRLSSLSNQVYWKIPDSRWPIAWMKSSYTLGAINSTLIQMTKHVSYGTFKNTYHKAFKSNSPKGF